MLCLNKKVFVWKAAYFHCFLTAVRNQTGVNLESVTLDLPIKMVQSLKVRSLPRLAFFLSMEYKKTQKKPHQHRR